MTSREEIVEFYQNLLPTAVACTIAHVISLIQFGLTKSYLNSKPLGMQSLYDSCSKICINCFLIMAIFNALNIVIFFICFGPVNQYLSFVLSLVAYFTTIITFVCLFFVQVVRYFYFTSNWIVVLDYYDENTTIFYFKQTIFAVSVILTLIEVKSK